MGKRFLILIGAAALGAALIATGASANHRSVHDPRGDTTCNREQGQHGPCSKSTKRSADIVRATAGHEDGRLRHTIRVVGKFQRGYLLINTDSDPGCFLVGATRGQRRPEEVVLCDSLNVSTGRARVDFRRHSVKIVFSERSIGNPQSYGWVAYATYGGPHADDRVPNVRYIRHRLGQTAAAASAGVVKYDTRLQITTDRGFLYHGWVLSDRDRNREYDRAKAVWKCMEGRRVILLKQRPGADRKLATVQSHIAYGRGDWGMPRGPYASHARVYAKVRPKVRDRFVCRADRSPIYGGGAAMYG